jgi:hypothetical protein
VASLIIENQAKTNERIGGQRINSEGGGGENIEESRRNYPSENQWRNINEIIIGVNGIMAASAASASAIRENGVKTGMKMLA